MNEFSDEAINAVRKLQSALRALPNRSGLIGLEGETITIDLSPTREDASQLRDAIRTLAAELMK